MKQNKSTFIKDFKSKSWSLLECKNLTFFICYKAFRNLLPVSIRSFLPLFYIPSCMGLRRFFHWRVFTAGYDWTWKNWRVDLCHNLIMLAGFTRHQQEKHKEDFNPLDFVWLKTATQETSNSRVDTDNRTTEQTHCLCHPLCLSHWTFLRAINSPFILPHSINPWALYAYVFS